MHLRDLVEDHGGFESPRVDPFSLRRKDPQC